MLVNVGGLVLGSLFSRQHAIERIQASLFVNVFDESRRVGVVWQGSAKVSDIYELVARFLGRDRADQAFERYGHEHAVDLAETRRADPELIQFAERLLAGAIGAASARVMVSSVVKGEMLGIDEVMTILDETSQVIEYSRRLEQKRRELEAATRELQEANERLRELDRLKDEFVSTVSHELRTPLTSIRSFSEILLDNPDMDVSQRCEFLGIIVKESERLTRLINEILDIAKMESGRLEWHMESLNLQTLVQHAVHATSQLFRDKYVELEVELGDTPAETIGDNDRLTQVVINLLSNAVKFCAEEEGRVMIRLRHMDDHARIEVKDNGPGIPQDQLESIFEKVHQVSSQQAGKPKGTGLGLSISRRIVEHHGGRIWAESEPDQGACFVVELPLRAAADREQEDIPA